MTGLHVLSLCKCRNYTIWSWSFQKRHTNKTSKPRTVLWALQLLSQILWESMKQRKKSLMLLSFCSNKTLSVCFCSWSYSSDIEVCRNVPLQMNQHMTQMEFRPRLELLVEESVCGHFKIWVLYVDLIYKLLVFIQSAKNIHSFTVNGHQHNVSYELLHTDLEASGADTSLHSSKAKHTFWLSHSSEWLRALQHPDNKCVSHFTPTQQSNNFISASRLCNLLELNLTGCTFQEYRERPWNHSSPQPFVSFSVEQLRSAFFTLTAVSTQNKDDIYRTDTEFCCQNLQQCHDGWDAASLCFLCAFLPVKTASACNVMPKNTFYTFMFFLSDRLKMNPQQLQEFRLTEAKLWHHWICSELQSRHAHVSTHSLMKKKTETSDDHWVSHKCDVKLR